jgi:thiamine biosynthesis lipoprotein
MKKLFPYVILISILIACTQRKPSLALKEITGKTMGTFFSVKIVDEETTNLNYKEIENEINTLLKEVNRQMSTYIEDSEISTFNKYSGTDWFTTSYDFAYVVDIALRVSYESYGAFDITVGPLVNLWGFGPEIKKFTIPSKSELDQAKSKTGYQNLEVSVDISAVKKDIPDLYLDLSAIAKGFGVDLITEYLESIKVKNFMVEIGGEVRTMGKNHEGEYWKIGIELPGSNSDIQKVVSISNFSIATSGDYHNYFEEDGVRYSHTIDPRTGMPITHKLASVTVVHSSCTLADAYATAINVMGPEAGYSFALENNLAVYFILRYKNVFIEKSTKQFTEYIKN